VFSPLFGDGDWDGVGKRGDGDVLRGDGVATVVKWDGVGMGPQLCHNIGLPWAPVEVFRRWSLFLYFPSL